MGATLLDIAQQLKDTNKKIQLIYAFNGTGKTRLSREFVNLIALEGSNPDDEEARPRKILYYNAHTEDLFYWDNDLEFDAKPKLRIQPNSFTGWILDNQGLDQRVVNNFQRLAGSKITPAFNENNTSVTFTTASTDYLVTEDGSHLITQDGDLIAANASDEVAKISRGEESNFVWSIFYTLLEQVISVLNIAEPEDRDAHDFDHLKYVFIDDPVSSLDENHLIELAVNLAVLVKLAPQELKFIITTHNPLFYNVLFNEMNSKKCYLLQRSEDGDFELIEKDGESNGSFSYHLHIKQLVEAAIAEGHVEKFHFTLVRNLYEKTASFLGYAKWTDLLDTVPGDKEAYLKRIITFSSHRTLSNEEAAEPTEPEKQSVKLLLDNLVKNYGFWKPEAEK